MSVDVKATPTVVCDRCGVSRHRINVLVLLNETACCYCVCSPTFDGSRAITPASKPPKFTYPAGRRCVDCPKRAEAGDHCLDCYLARKRS